MKNILQLAKKQTDQPEAGNVKVNYEGGSISTGDLFILTGQDQVALKMKKKSQLVLKELIPNE